jgi:hypothetical protein
LPTLTDVLGELELISAVYRQLRGASPAHALLCFNVECPAEALYDSAAMRSFVGIDLGREPAPDETTVCKFRHLLEKHKLGEPLFKALSRTGMSRVSR